MTGVGGRGEAVFRWRLCLQGLWGGKAGEGPAVRGVPSPPGPTCSATCGLCAHLSLAASSLDPSQDISRSGCVSYVLGLMFFEDDLKSN